MNHSAWARSVPFLVAVLAGCASAPNVSPQTTIAAPARLADGGDVRADPPLPQWWHLYHAPVLDALVDEALVNNRDLRAAAAHLLEARAMFGAAQAARGPGTDVAAGVGEGSTLQDQIAAASAGSDHVRTGPRLDMGGDVAWEPDLFGRLAATTRAARADADAAAALRDGVRIAVAAGVTGAWLDACGFAQRADLARRALVLAQRARNLAAQMQAAGARGPADLLLAEAAVSEAEAALVLLEAGHHNALVQLTVLTGHVPGNLASEAAACTRVPAIDGPLPIGDGLSLLRRRPDVRAAERRLAASTARIGVAVADLYPRIALNGGAAVSSPTVSGLAAPGNWVWRVGPLFSWSFPALGVARARIRQARAGERAALATLDATVLTALGEVNQSAQTCGAALHRQAALRAAAAHRAEADRLAQRSRAAGALDALDALEAQRVDLAAQAVLASADAEVAAAQVHLFKALGGGWQGAPPVLLPDPTRIVPPHEEIKP